MEFVKVESPETSSSEAAIATTSVAEETPKTHVAGGDNSISTPPLSFTKHTKAAIRRSLQASTLDGVAAAVFSNMTNGVLLTNFLLELGATPFEIGLLASIPLFANLLQPLGAYWSEQTTSRHYFCLGVYAPARVIWFLLVIGIALANSGKIESHALIGWTLAIAGFSYGLGALGGAPWFSWIATLVPRRLRGRYFGFRNSAANLTNLISMPLLGLLIAHWQGGSLQGYGIALVLGTLAGLISLWFQNFIVDVNPQVQHTIILEDVAPKPSLPETSLPETSPLEISIPTASVSSTSTESKGWGIQNANFLRFLFYFTLWTFAINLSAPFFNFYLLDNLHLDISQATLYNSLTAGANLVMLILWGRLADRVGNRPLLLGVGVVVAAIPLLWLLVNGEPLSVWLWLPLLHLAMGGSIAAIDLCSSNLQIGVVPIQNQSTYFGTVAAIAGVSGALGTLAGGFLAQSRSTGGILGLFILSAILRLLALAPLVWVQEDRSHSLRQLMRAFWPVDQETSQTSDV